MWSKLWTDDKHPMTGFIQASLNKFQVLFKPSKFKYFSSLCKPCMITKAHHQPMAQLILPFSDEIR